MTLVEVAAWGIPSILVPYPHATADHQHANARWMADGGAALVLAGAAVQTGTSDSRSMQGGVSISVAGGLSFGVAYAAIGIALLGGIAVAEIVHKFTKANINMTIAESIRRGEPALVVFATPVYCVSRFCGPITDMVEDLAERYGDRANFIHVEIWRNYENQVINKGAADWLYHGSDLTEPWVFLIGADGRIEARWDNVATPEEIEPYLDELPKQ
mgnify:CR=1 FL=1